MVSDAAFLEDLMLWLRFQVSYSAAQQQQQQQQQLEQQPRVADVYSSVASFADEQQLALMADVGRDMLLHSLSCGAVGVAGEG